MAILGIPGIGPKTVLQLHTELGIASVEDLQVAAQEGRLRTIRGLSGKTEAQILEGIARIETRSSRMLLDRAAELVDGLIATLEGTDGLVSLTPAGSFRRRRESIGDLDLLAETADGAAVIERFDRRSGSG